MLHRTLTRLWTVLILLASESLWATGPCAEFVPRLPNVRRALCEAVKLEPSQARSVQGRTLWMRDVKPAETTFRVLVVGAIHGDELSSAAVALHWIQMAAQAQVPGSPGIYWRFVPVLNPDGVLGRSPTRVNANGVDLNRNFPTENWARDSKVYWEQGTHRDPRRWPGKLPLSEPESKFLFGELQSFKPNLIVSIHAPFGVLDFDGPVVPPKKLGSLLLAQVGIFPGSLGNYGGVQRGVPVVTVELPNALRTPRDAEIRRMWLDLLRWMDQRMGVAQRVAAARKGTYLDNKWVPAAPTAE